MTARRVRARWTPSKTSSIQPVAPATYFEGVAVLDGAPNVVFYHTGTITSVVRVSELEVIEEA